MVQVCESPVLEQSKCSVEIDVVWQSESIKNVKEIFISYYDF